MTTWSIGEAAAKCGLSQHTLRWYERIGLLAKIERGSDGRRRFSEGDLEWLSLLTKLRATGMPVRDMQRYAELVRSGAGEAERLELLKKHRDTQQERLGVSLAPIPGTKRVKWLEQNVAAMDVTLTPGELTVLDPLATQVVGNRY